MFHDSRMRFITMKTPRNTAGRHFSVRILLPAVLALTLFVLSLYQIIIPQFEDIILGRKREMIRELTTSAWHVLDHCYQEQRAGRMTEAEAQAAAVSQVGHLRYGDEGKDYFWITDLRPYMVVHPFRDDLIGSDLSDVTDLQGKRLFVEMVEAVRADGEGFVDYTWQWKDDSTRIVPKLSFVKRFAPWGWIVGTGIYLEDVHDQIAALERDVVTISLWITVTITLLLTVIVMQNLRAERRRSEAERRLREAMADELDETREKYRSLTSQLPLAVFRTQASGGMTLLECNAATAALFGRSSIDELTGVDFASLFAERPEFDAYAAELMREGVIAHRFEDLRRSDGAVLTAALSVALVRDEDGKPRFCDVLAEDRSSERSDDERTRRLLADMQTPLLFLAQPVETLLREVPVCGTRHPLSSILRLMTRAGSDAVLLRDDAGAVIGIVGMDEVRNAVQHRERAMDLLAHEIMRAPLPRIAERASVHEALLLMAAMHADVVAVQDPSGAVRGIVAIEDLHRSSLHSYLGILRQMQQAGSPAEIGLERRQLVHTVAQLIEGGAGTRHITHTLTAANDAAMRRAIALALEVLGPAPCDFTFLVLGSEGRREQTLATDQDNAILYADVDAETKEYAASWFLQLGEQVCRSLNEAGYPYCPGGIMAMNPKWCRPMSEWKRYFTGWITTSDPQDLLEISIFFDFRSMHGEASFAETLRTHVFDTASGYHSFFAMLAQNALRTRPPSWQFKPAETIDVKAAMLPIVDLARVYALRHRVSATGTTERLQQLQARGVFSVSGARDIIQAYELMLALRFREQARAIAANRTPGNIISTATLSDIDLASLRRAFTHIETFQSKLSVDFKGMM